jgi:hypothetical protein
VTRVVELCSFTYLFIGEALAAERDALHAKDGGNTGFGDAIQLADQLSSFTGLVPMHDIGDVIGGQEPFRPRFWTIRLRQSWSRRCLIDGFP